MEGEYSAPDQWGEDTGGILSGLDYGSGKGTKEASCILNNPALVNTHPIATSWRALLPLWIIRLNA